MFQFAYLYTEAFEERIPDYYLQDEKYFNPIIKHLYSDGITKTDRVSIHVRRGDYVNNSFYVDLMTTDYYKQAMEQFPNEKFIVFSDDIEWCKTKEIFRGCEFSEGKTELEDMNLMAGCKHNIIANSSFSWWGAYLNPNPNKLVIYPKRWYTDGVERTVCPKTWKAL